MSGVNTLIVLKCRYFSSSAGSGKSLTMAAFLPILWHRNSLEVLIPAEWESSFGNSAGTAAILPLGFSVMPVSWKKKLEKGKIMSEKR